MDYNDMTDAQQDAFWQEVTWENAEAAVGDVYCWRREAANKVMEGLQESIKRLGFGGLGNPTIAVYAEELARLARLPDPTHDCLLPTTPADLGAAA
jgi:hypothetical protein